MKHPEYAQTLLDMGIHDLREIIVLGDPDNPWGSEWSCYCGFHAWADRRVVELVQHAHRELAIAPYLAHWRLE